MLTAAGITNPTTQLLINIYLSLWCLFTAVLGCSLADKIGRKKLGAGTISVSLFFLYLVGAFTKREFILLTLTTMTHADRNIVYGNGENYSGSLATVACIFLYQGTYDASRARMLTNHAAYRHLRVRLEHTTGHVSARGLEL
jgi:hypothetical protein